MHLQTGLKTGPIQWLLFINYVALPRREQNIALLIKAQEQKRSYKPENAEACCNNDKCLYPTVIRLNMVITDYSTIPKKIMALS